MNFGMIYLSTPNKEVDKHPYREVHERTTQQILKADAAGYDFAWIAEHHASDNYGVMPDPLVYIAYLASLTKNIRLGAGVVVLPLHNLVRLVENISLVDILLNGRLTIGLGSGYRPYEFEALGADFETRRDYVADALPVMLEMFNTHQVVYEADRFPRFSIKGEQELYPRPIQEPHPPFWMGVSSPESIARAAQYGLGIGFSTLTPTHELAEKTRYFFEQCEKTEAPYNKNLGRRNVDISRYVYVAESDAQAKKETEGAIVRQIHQFTGPGTEGYLGNVSKGNQERYFAASYDQLNEDTIIHGSADTVCEKIADLQDRTGATGLILHMPPYYSQEQATANIERFAEQVIPRFR